MADRDGDGPRKTWRERDAQRNRSSSAGGSSGSASGRPDGDRGAATAADRASRQYRAALEALFDKGGLAKVADKLGADSLAPASSAAPVPVPVRATAPTPPADSGKAALRKKIVDAIGRDAITRAVEKYLKEHPLPEDWEVLEQVLEHRADDRVHEALALLEAMLQRDRPKRTRVMAAKLRFIEETTDAVDLRERSARVRARLG